MEKTATLNLRVNPIAKQRAENVLKQLGIPMCCDSRVKVGHVGLGTITEETYLSTR